jgi:hypothetical protein
MSATVVVTYRVRPETVAEHLALVEGVFAQLREEARTDVSYEVLRLDDGVSFVHVSTADTADGSNPLPGLAAFRAFAADLASRVEAPPVSSPADVVAAYSPTA